MGWALTSRFSGVWRERFFGLVAGAVGGLAASVMLVSSVAIPITVVSVYEPGGLDHAAHIPESAHRRKYALPPGYQRQQPIKWFKLGPWQGAIDAILEDDKQGPAKQRHTAESDALHVRYP